MIPVAIPVINNCDYHYCANGLIMIGSRVKTKFIKEEGGDDKWYNGVCTRCNPNNTCTILYDDGDNWIGCMEDVYLIDIVKPKTKSKCRLLQCILS